MCCRGSNLSEGIKVISSIFPDAFKYKCLLSIFQFHKQAKKCHFHLRLFLKKEKKRRSPSSRQRFRCDFVLFFFSFFYNDHRARWFVAHGRLLWCDRVCAAGVQPINSVFLLFKSLFYFVSLVCWRVCVCADLFFKNLRQKHLSRPCRSESASNCSFSLTHLNCLCPPQDNTHT